MNVVVFGATGMVGQGVLRECLNDERIDGVTTVGRRKTGVAHGKLTELERDDLYSFADGEFESANACFFCLGVTSTGMSEVAYTRITCGLTMAAAKAFRPGATFSGRHGEADARHRQLPRVMPPRVSQRPGVSPWGCRLVVEKTLHTSPEV